MSIKIVLEHTLEEIEHIWKAMESHAKLHNFIMMSVKAQAEAQVAAAQPQPDEPAPQVVTDQAAQ